MSCVDRVRSCLVPERHLGGAAPREWTAPPRTAAEAYSPIARKTISVTAGEIYVCREPGKGQSALARRAIAAFLFAAWLRWMTPLPAALSSARLA